MAKLTFFPLGNADCCRIDFDNGKKLLFDFAATRDPSDKSDLRIDLPKELRNDLQAARRNHYEVVAFTHLDKDHYAGASEFFYFEHAQKYQGGDRVRIGTLWVPAAVIVEKAPDEDEARIIQSEARYRLKEGRGNPRLLAARCAQGLVGGPWPDPKGAGPPHHGCRAGGAGVQHKDRWRRILRPLAVRKPPRGWHSRRSEP